MTHEQAEKLGRSHAREALDVMRSGDNLHAADDYRDNLGDTLDEMGVTDGNVVETAYWSFDATIKQNSPY